MADPHLRPPSTGLKRLAQRKTVSARNFWAGKSDLSDSPLPKLGIEEWSFGPTGIKWPATTSRCCAPRLAATPTTPALIELIGQLHDAPQPATVDYIDGLIGVADQAMYAAKRRGGNHARHRPSPVPEGPHSH
jgi:hypothetical protein